MSEINANKEIKQVRGVGREFGKWNGEVAISME